MNKCLWFRVETFTMPHQTCNKMWTLHLFRQSLCVRWAELYIIRHHAAVFFSVSRFFSPFCHTLRVFVQESVRKHMNGNVYHKGRVRNTSMHYIVHWISPRFHLKELVIGSFLSLLGGCIVTAKVHNDRCRRELTLNYRMKARHVSNIDTNIF